MNTHRYLMVAPKVTAISAVQTELQEPHVTTSVQDLREQNQRSKGTGEISEENRGYGFLPAFRNVETGTVYLSRFADGRLAPLHLLEGLPPEIVATCPRSRITATKTPLTAGFMHSGRFYSRQEAAQAIMEFHPHNP